MSILKTYGNGGKNQSGGSNPIKTRRDIRINTPVPQDRAESEMYRIYSSGKGAGQYKKEGEEPTPKDMWMKEHPKKGATEWKEYDPKSEAQKTYEEEGWEFKKDYINPMDVKLWNKAYDVKTQPGTNRLYPDISEKYPYMETEGDKHWNIKRFAYGPFFGKTPTAGQHHYNIGTPTESGAYPADAITGHKGLDLPEGDRARKRLVLEDVYKYNLTNPEMNRNQAWRESKKFIRKEINPLLRSDYHKWTGKGVWLGEPASGRGKDFEWYQSVDIYNETADRPISDRRTMRGMADYNRRFRNMPRREARQSARETQNKYKTWKKESLKGIIGTYE